MIRALASLLVLITPIALSGCSVGTDDLASEPTATTTGAPGTAPSPAATADPPGTCPVVVASEALGRIENPELTETSGLATSELNPDVIWAHNDSEGAAAVYAVGRDGSDRGTFVLEGTSNRDWEDMARWTDPASGVSWLYVGDIGDALGQFDSVLVHRVPEPVVGTTAQEITLGAVETFEFTYPDGPRDAETLLVDPATGAITIIGKGDGVSAGIYEASGATPGSVTELTEAGALDLSGTLLGQATSGDHLGEFVLIRTYFAVLGYPTAAAPWWESDPCELEPPFELQGESITAEPDAAGYITASEGRSARINRSAVG